MGGLIRRLGTKNIIKYFNVTLGRKANKTDIETAFTTKRTHLDTRAEDTSIPFEIHNQAGQAGVDVSSEVTHHYTDATGAEV
jgi:hypothetical protein